MWETYWDYVDQDKLLHDMEEWVFFHVMKIMETLNFTFTQLMYTEIFWFLLLNNMGVFWTICF